MARRAGLEPATYGLEIRCSIQLSYQRTIFEKGKFTRPPSNCQTRFFPYKENSGILSKDAS